MPQVPTLTAAGNVAQYPAKTSGLLGENGFLAPISFQVGTGGMPAVGRFTPSGGIPTGIVARTDYPGFAVTLVGTGLYNVTLPPAPWSTVMADVSAPSGRAFHAKRQYNRGDCASGLVKVQTFEHINAANVAVPANAPTGSIIDMLVYVNPRNSAGLTRF